jgi:predicted transcriptional regulator YdeE
VAQRFTAAISALFSGVGFSRWGTALRFFGFASIILLTSVILVGQAVTPEKVHRDGFSIIGIEARTSNAKEISGQGVIPAQWQKWQNRLTATTKKPEVHAADGNTYAVYTDYASDRNGEYSFLIGVKADERATVPPGMVQKKIPAGDYALIRTDKGPANKVVVAAWQRVWALEDKAQLGGPRAYKADFEVYGPGSVDLYIGLK